MDVKERKALVVGLGRSGLSASNFLLKRGARVTVTDRRSEGELQATTKLLAGPAHLSVGGHRMEDFLGADFVVLSPGVPTSLPELQEVIRRGTPVLSEVELAYRFLKGKVVGITGSNGKTTTTTLIGELLGRAGHACVVAGNIGSPLIDWVDSADTPPGTTFVVELSSFQLENIQQFRCDIALMLNIAPDHQDRYGSFQDYLHAKEQIFRNQTATDHAVLNADDPHTLEMAQRCRASVLLYSRQRTLERGVFVRNGSIEFCWNGQREALMSVGELQLKGGHNQENVLAAAAVGVLCQLDGSTMIDTFRQFQGVEHRLEWVRDISGVAFYNDSKATNLASAQSAVEAFDRPLILVMGGQNKGVDFRGLRELAAEKVRRLVVLGEASDEIRRSLEDVVRTVGAADMTEAVRLAFQEARPGDVVLLSPGCASFDMFKDFEHRGRVFKEAVNGLGEPPSPLSMSGR